MFEPGPSPASDPVEHFVEAARQIQRAGSVAQIASAVAHALPGLDTSTRGALEGCLSALELSLAQRAVTSLELASDLRIDTRRKLTRLMGGGADAELSSSIADMAVQAVAGLSGTLAIARAASAAGTEAVAFAGLSGSMFISARAQQFARDHALPPAALEALLGAAAAPIRKACSVAETCNVGELRYTARAHGIAASASLDTSIGGAPVVCIRLHAADEPIETVAQDGSPQIYAARLLRRLVS